MEISIRIRKGKIRQAKIEATIPVLISITGKSRKTISFLIIFIIKIQETPIKISCI